MKKIIFTLAIGMIFLVSCKTVGTATVATTELEQPEVEKPVIWKQNLYPKITVDDPILFLNSSEIIMDGSSKNQTFFLQDGDIVRMDSILVITKTVPRLTSGVLVSMKKTSNGIIEEMNISFSQEDATYTFNFRLKDDRSFTLNSNAKLLYKNKEYKIQVVTKGGECILLVNFKVTNNIQNVNESARGQKSVSGTRVIK